MVSHQKVSHPKVSRRKTVSHQKVNHQKDNHPRANLVNQQTHQANKIQSKTESAKLKNVWKTQPMR